MKKNILITGFDTLVAESVAKDIADTLGLYYLSIPELTLYYANRSSKEIVIKEGGLDLYDKFVKFAVKDAEEFENMVAGADFSDLKKEQVERLLDSALIIFLGESYTSLKHKNVCVEREVVNYSRYKLKDLYDIYVNIDNVKKEELKDIILGEITSYYGG